MFPKISMDTMFLSYFNIATRFMVDFTNFSGFVSIGLITVPDQSLLDCRDTQNQTQNSK